ncbi:MAG: hypothetical protein E5W26_00170 [Mesorhizobium sp.]|nr:MAG: hypothetical protein E5W26_00170 [Mesorhizobium sp.]
MGVGRARRLGIVAGTIGKFFQMRRHTRLAAADRQGRGGASAGSSPGAWSIAMTIDTMSGSSPSGLSAPAQGSADTGAAGTTSCGPVLWGASEGLWA